MGELSKETIFIDGTKLEACANKYTFVWKKSVGKWEEKMYEKIENAVQMVNREYMQDFCISKENRTSVLHKMVDYLDHYCRENSIVFVHGRGKRKSMHQRYLELFHDFLTDSFFMTCIIHVLATATAISKRMWMPHSCT